MPNPSMAELANRVGEEIAVSPWHAVAQDQIDRFAELTGDKQWIHVDRERARAGQFQTTVAHGFLTLALLPRFAAATVTPPDRRMAVNYGLNRVRFPSPVLSGSHVRARFTLAACEPIEGGLQATWQVTVEREGGEKPCLVAEWVVRYYR